MAFTIPIQIPQPWWWWSPFLCCEPQARFLLFQTAPSDLLLVACPHSLGCSLLHRAAGTTSGSVPAQAGTVSHLTLGVHISAPSSSRASGTYPIPWLWILLPAQCAPATPAGVHSCQESARVRTLCSKEATHSQTMLLWWGALLTQTFKEPLSFPSLISLESL